MSDRSASTQHAGSSLLMTGWYAGMIFCTGSLYALGVASMDSSVIPYTAMGIIAMFIAPVKKLISAMIAHREFQRKYEERKRMAEALKAQLTQMEQQELENRKRTAAAELAKRQAAKEAA